MTSTGPSPLAPDPTDPAVPLRVGDLPELVASVPSLIGFRPRESLVLIGLGGESGRRIVLTMRIDLPPPEQARLHEPAARVATGLLAARPQRAVLVVYAAGDGPVRRELVAAVAAALGERGVPVHTAVWAEAAAAGAAWACYDGCCAGRLTDPSSTTAAVTCTAAGQVVYADRAELERLVEPVDPARVRRHEELLIAAAAADLAAAEPGADDDAGHLAVLAAAIAEAAAGGPRLDDDRVVALAAALVRPRVRDAALARCAEWSTTDRESAAAAESLWAALCRELPDPEAAEAAVLLAASGLLRGDGALANVALARAERSWPGHRLAGLLGDAVGRGAAPGRVREWLLSCPGLPAWPVR